jgi:hypothetical protein
MSAPRPCIVEGCDRFAQGGSRCPAHEAAHQARRARYGPAHQRLRRWWTRAIEDGALVLCSRCGLPVSRIFDLDHIDGGEHPAHIRCNRSEPNQRRTS